MADNEFDASGWLEPAPSQCRHFAGLIPSATRDLEASLQPAPAEVMDRCLATLAVCCAPRGGESAAVWAGRAAEYKRLLGRFPADIWRSVCDAWPLTPDKGRWYPTVAELAERMQAAVDQRQRQIDRLRRMQAIAGQQSIGESAAPRYHELSPDRQRAVDDAFAKCRAILGRDPLNAPKQVGGFLPDVTLPNGPGSEASRALLEGRTTDE